MSVVKPELLLCIDTSTPTGSVALVSGTTVLVEIAIQVSQRTHSDYLLRFVQIVLAESGYKIGDIDALVVVAGPGSFTGLRVGLATVQGLAQAHSVPIYPVSSLQAVAFANSVTELPVRVLIDARKKEVYTACYVWNAGVPQLQGCEEVLSPEVLLDRVETKSLFVGNGASLYSEDIKTKLSDLAILSHGLNAVPHASAAGLLVNALGDRAQRVNFFELRPVYIRPSDAELQHFEKR